MLYVGVLRKITSWTLSSSGAAPLNPVCCCHIVLTVTGGHAYSILVSRVEARMRNHVRSTGVEGSQQTSREDDDDLENGTTPAGEDRGVLVV